MKTFHPHDEQCDTYDRIVTPDGTELVAVDDTSRPGCKGCAFQSHQHVDGLSCRDTPFCSDSARDDNRTIIWVKA